MAAPVLASSDNAPNSATCNKPAGTVSGDTLYAQVIVYDSTTVTVTPPTGWTSVSGPSRVTTGNLMMQQIFRKVAGGSEPSSYTFASSTGNYECVGIVRVTGADTTASEDGAAGWDSVTDGSSTTRRGKSVTTTGADRLLLLFSAGYGGAPTSTPAGMTGEYINDAVNAAYHQAIASAGATGDRTHTQGSGDSWITSVVAVASPSSGTNVALTGQGLGAAAGALAKTAAIGLSGQALGAAQGTLTPSAPASVALTGQALTAAQGALAPGSAITLSGLSASFGQGTLTASAGSNVSVALTGQSASAAAAALGFTVSASVTLSGLVTSLAQGALAPAVSRTLTGQALSSAQGSLSQTPTLSGKGLSAGQGALSPSATGQNTAVALVGQGSSVSQAAFELGGGWKLATGDADSWVGQVGDADSWSCAAASGGDWNGQAGDADGWARVVAPAGSWT